MSPLLFAIAVDLLQSVINFEFEQGNLQPPFPQNLGTPFPIIQYADNTILIMQGCESQLLHLKEILQLVALSSGLRVSYQKTCLVPINVDPEKTISHANAFGCAIGAFPFTYLGLPMGLTKP